MSEGSDVYNSSNIYEENLNDETTCDLSSRELEAVPVLSNKQLSALYLQNNKITALPDDFFPLLPSLMWLDLRNNLLTEIPKSIQNHPSLTHLLLQNNKITTLPNEIGTVVTLKVLQLNGNPLMYPPRDVITAGISKILHFLHNKYIENIFLRSQSEVSESACRSENSLDHIFSQAQSYNSVVDKDKLKKTLSVQFSERDQEESDEEYYAKIKGKCPKLAKSRHKTLPTYFQSSKYLKPLTADSRAVQNEKIKQNYFKELAIKKHKDFIARRDKILQDRKNIELLRNWRTTYKKAQLFNKSTYKLDAKNYPYDTNPEYMALLSREDLEKDLPDKYKRRLLRRSKPTVPRKSNNDVHLAMKIKQLFENLEAIDLNRDGMTPRTEQKVLLNEIQKISVIKQKLMELSTTNVRSVIAD